MQRLPRGTKWAVTVPMVASLAALAWIGASSAQASHLAALKRIVGGAESAHPNALWHIVHGLCLRDMKTSGSPAPCAEVNLSGGYAVVKDVERKTQYLLIPTERVTGIESPALLSPRSPNYWQAAWTSRRWIEKQVGRPIPREDIGLAVNSVFGRTQNQLHIHIDCVQPQVRDALRTRVARIGPHWSTVKPAIQGRSYRVRWLSETELAAADPFKLLAHNDPIARADMGMQSLALIGATRPDGTPGFVLISDHSDDGHGAAVEELLDHHCQVLNENGA